MASAASEISLPMSSTWVCESPRTMWLAAHFEEYFAVGGIGAETADVAPVEGGAALIGLPAFAGDPKLIDGECFLERLKHPGRIGVDVRPRCPHRDDERGVAGETEDELRIVGLVVLRPRGVGRGLQCCQRAFGGRRLMLGFQQLDDTAVAADLIVDAPYGLPAGRRGSARRGDPFGFLASCGRLAGC